MAKQTLSPKSAEAMSQEVSGHVRTFWQDFREFALQGNVIDLTVGVVIGTAFKQLTTSLVEDIVMPPIGLLLGNADFTELYLNLSGGQYSTLADAQAAGAATLNYGLFITNLIDFFLVALSVYIVLRFVLRHNMKSE
ncbi:large conductance mechanosensitive channel protein MscL [Candidatus Woesebacteria bacterium]|nr:large conductance mechanosensitive channel protein MscL [Candidatus Woesebacteria bacterium]MCD8506969.1 large conductance mechanosensitive channel protein MscL [Candidatus Woesebacteria bacterium]MCD8527260.1 large conductance mechanosensitive channel protein MscL [Candidatus Woesebacteria bacterium]MCD8546627.1 large conductance mechanosensitive channel protein MscL [Candidatus Woesebacteria bacterium]